MLQPHNDQGSFDEDFHNYVLEEQIEQPIILLNVPAAMLLPLMLAGDSQLFCLLVQPQSPAAGSLSPAAAEAATATASPASPT